MNAPVVIGLVDTRTEAMSAQVVSRIMVILAQVITDLEDIKIEATIKPLTLAHFPPTMTNNK